MLYFEYKLVLYLAILLHRGEKKLPLIIRTQAFQEESLSSYMHRLAKFKCISNHELWRSITPTGVHYPQTSMSSYIDVCPINLIDMKKFGQMLLSDTQTLESHTFIPVLEKMNISREALPAARCLSGLTSEHRRFCPECLKKNNFYKLIWQVKELNFCPEHNVKLEGKCPNCSKPIPVLPNNNTLGQCPQCNFELFKCFSERYEANDIDYRVLNDWFYLLDGSKATISNINGLSIQQNLAIRTLFICKHSDLSKRELTTSKGIYQIARESKSTQTFLHLKTVLYFSRLSNTPLEEFFTSMIPDDFIDNIFKKPSLLKISYYCIAPWCKNYLKAGKLERTTTSTKHLTSEYTLNYYMYCPCCSTEYAIDKKSKELKERGYFINLAWDKVKNSLDSNLSLDKLATLFSTTEDKIKRCIIFLSTNSLINKKNLQIELPKEHDLRLEEKIIELINLGWGSKKIRATLGLNHNSFLSYWFLPQIRIAYINRYILRPDKIKIENNLCSELDHAIKYLVEKNSLITVKSICNILDTCPETLRKWGLLDKIQKAKTAQSEIIRKNQSNLYIDSSKKYIIQQNLSGNHVFSDELYLHLGKKRNVIVRTMPDVTRKIADLLKNQSV